MSVGRWHSIPEAAFILGFDEGAIHEAIALRQLAIYKHKTWDAPRVSHDSLDWFAKRYNLRLSWRHPDSVTYFIQAVDGGPIKIGTARDVSARLAELQVANPNELVILGTTPLPEASVHRRFAHLRIRGEWFTASASLLAEIPRMCL